MLYAHGKGRYQAEYADLWKQLVPLSGQADTVQGELVRVVGRLASEYYRNGNSNWDMGFRLFTNYLYRYLRDQKVFESSAINQSEDDIAAVRACGSGRGDIAYTEAEDPFDRLTDRVVEWCRKHPEPLPIVENAKLGR